MKSTFTFFMFSCLLLLSLNGTSQEASVTFVQSFRAGNSLTVILDANGSAAVQPWDETYVRVQMVVSLEQGSEAQLRALARQGRYRLSAEYSGDTLSLADPILDCQVRFNGKVLNEQIHYIIHVPHGVIVVKQGDGNLEFLAI